MVQKFIVRILKREIGTTAHASIEVKNSYLVVITYFSHLNKLHEFDTQNN